MTTVALYEIASEYREAVAKLADLDLDEQTLADTLESLSGDLESKATNVAYFIAQTEATAAAMKQAEANMAARRKAVEARAARVREYLQKNLKDCGISKIEGPALRIAIRQNPEAVEVFDAKQVPQSYLTGIYIVPSNAEGIEITRDGDFFCLTGPISALMEELKPAKDAIKATLKSGADVPGCKLTRGERLEIK